MALVGCGYWGKNYLRTLRDMKEVNLRWICDIAAENKGSYAFSPAKITKDYNNILEDKKVKGIIIATPTPTHYNLAIKALEAKKDILIEKPMCSNSKDCLSLIKESKSQKSILIPGHIFAHNPAVQELEKRIKEGYLGKILSMNALRLSLGPIRDGDNAMWDLMPHDISMFLRFKEEYPMSVQAIGSSFLRKNAPEDAVILTLKYQEGGLATAHGSWVYPKKIRELIVVGDKKMAVFDDVSTNKLTYFDSGVKEVANVDLNDYYLTARTGNILIPKLSGRSPLEIQCENFVECIKTRRPARVSSQEGYKVVEILEKAQKSLKQKKEIKL